MDSESITLLIPHNRPPYVQDYRTMYMKNIIHELRKKCNLKVVWVIFQPKKTVIEKTSSNDLLILNLHDYHDALEILEETKPDVVIINPQLEFVNLSFALTARFKNIPVVTTFLSFSTALLEKIKPWNLIKMQSRLLFASKIPIDISKDTHSRPFNQFTYLFEKYVFLIKSLQKINYSKFQLLKFNSFILKKRIFSYYNLDPIFCGDLNLVSTPNWIDKLTKLGLTKNSLALVGNPQYDHLFIELPKTKSIPKTDSSKTRILLCSSPMYEHGYWSKKEEGNLIVNVLDEISKHNELEIAIKIHPSSSSIKEYEQLVKKTGNKIPIYQKEDLVELLRSYDVIIIYGSSSVLLYCVLLKKPLVFLKFGSKFKSDAYVDERVQTICTSPENLMNKINESKSRKISSIDYENFVEKHLYKFDGKSSHRIAKEILALVKRNKNNILSS